MLSFSSPRDRAQLLIAVLGAGVVIALWPYLTGLLGAVILYVVVAPVHRRLRAPLGTRTAAAVVLLATAMLLLLPGAWLLNVLIAQAPATFRSLQESVLFSRLATIDVAGVNVGAQIAAAGGTILSWISRQAIDVFGSATRSVLNLVIAFFGLYYLLLAPASAWERVARALPFSRASADLLRARFQSVTEAMLLGTALTAILQGAIIGAGFWLVGLPNAVFWGVITALVSIVPVLGSALVWLPGVLVLLASQRYGAALALAALGAGLASNLDNVIRPLIYRRVSNIHPFTTLIGAFAGVSLFGLVGLLLGPLAISYVFELMQIYEAEYGQPAPPDPVTGGSLAPPPDVAPPAVGIHGR